ncbi:MAG TPA: hypothetical protein PKA64_06225 [Myxococcota bacterium]|nr:hypothetical protein [Myxococcota bacterium]
MSLFHGLLHRPKPTVGPKPGPTADDGLSDPLGETLADPLDGPQIDDDPTGDPNTAKTLNANTGGDPTGAPDDPGDPDDADVTSYRDRREAAIQEQGNNDQLHTTELSLDKAFPLYREVLAAQGDAVTAPTYERVHAAVNSEAFTAPGKAANASHVDAGAVDRLQTHVLNQYGGGHYALQLHDGIVGYWRPQLIKYEDGEPDKGPLDLFRKKRKEWKRLARNERAQKLEEWGVVKLLHKLFQWKQNKGPRLDEVTWLVESDAEARAAIQAHLANVSVPKPSSIPKQAAPPAPPSYESVADLATYAKALDPHLKLLNGGGFEVAANVKHRKLGGDKVLDKHLREVLPVIANDAGMHDDAQGTADALGLQIDWATTWADDEADVEPTGGDDKREVKGWLTVAGMPGIMELEMPVYDAVGGQVVQKVHLGDRLAWTGHISVQAGEPWAEIQLDEERTGFVQARYTNGAAVVDQIKKKDNAGGGPVIQNTTGTPDATPKQQVPLGLEDRGLLVARDASGDLACNSDVFGQGRASTSHPGPFGLVTETGPGSTSKAELLVDGKPVYADRKLLRPAKEADRIMAGGALDVTSIQKVRYALANDPDLQAEPARKEAYNLRLQALAPTAPTTAPAANGKPSPTLASIATALVSLGVPSPYPDQTFTDALEMVRIEKGLKDANPATLAAALGLGAEKVPSGGIGAALSSGKAVLVRRGEVWIRVTGVDPDGGLTGEQSGKPVLMKAAEAAKLDAVALGVPAELDGDPAALEARFVEQGVRLDADATKKTFEEGVYANTTAIESAWYVEHVKKDKARSGAGGDLEAYRPATGDGARFAKSDPTKLAEVVSRYYGPLGTAPTAGTSGDGLWPAGHKDVQAFLDGWWAAAQSDPKAQARTTPSRDLIARRFSEWADVLAKADLGLAQAFLIEVGKAPHLAGAPLPTAGIAEVITRYSNAGGDTPTPTNGGGTVAKKKDASIANFDVWSDANVTGGGSYTFSTEGRDASKMFYRVPSGTVTATGVTDATKTIKIKEGESLPLVRTEAVNEGKKKGRNVIVKKDEQEWVIYESNDAAWVGKKNVAGGTDPIWDLTYASTMTGADGTSSVEHNLDTHKRDHTTRVAPGKGKTKDTPYYDMQVTGEEAKGTRAGLTMYKGKPAVILPNSEGVMMFADGAVVTDADAKKAKPSSSRELVRGTIGEVNGQLYFLPGRDSNVIEDTRELWPIAPSVVEKMQEIQRDKVKQLEKSKEDKLTANQKDLLKKADTFTSDPTLASQYPKFTVSHLEEDGEQLSGDLVARMQRMWQFFQYAGLCTRSSTPNVASGIRARKTAHKLSVKWSFNTAGGDLEPPQPDASGKYHPIAEKKSYKKSVLMNNVMALETVSGNKGTDKLGMQWAKAETVDEYDAARQEAAKLANAGQQSDADAKLKGAAETLWKKLSTEYKLGGSAVDKTGQPKEETQTAPANEGYPVGYEERWPTPTEVSVSNHCGGEAMDITFPLTIGMSDPIVDLIGAHFGLHRPIAYSGSEDWHWERVGINITR